MSTQGFFVEFFIVDTLSLIIPRIVIGLNRDKEKTGHLNYQAGAEEAGREILSGPSMNLIPMGLAAIISALKPASHMERGTLSGLTHNMSELLKTNPGNEDLNKKFAGKLFDDAFASFKLDDKEKLKGEFSKLLTEAQTLKRKEFKSKAAEFEQLVIKINNMNKAKIPLNTKVLSINTDAKDAATVKAVDLIKDFKNYSKDAIEKLTKQSLNKDESIKFLNKIKTNRLMLKTASAITAFFAVGTFLQYLPKIYQLSKISPAAQSAKRAEGGANENA